VADEVVRDLPPEDWQQQLAEVISFGRFDTVLQVIDGWRPQPPVNFSDDTTSTQLTP
jgi:hypothetical protein